MIDECAIAANAALVSFLQAFARLIAQELRRQPGAQVIPRIEEPTQTRPDSEPA